MPGWSWSRCEQPPMPFGASAVGPWRHFVEQFIQYFSKQTALKDLWKNHTTSIVIGLSNGSMFQFAVV